MYDIGISEIAVTAKYEDTEDTEDILKKPLPFSDILRINIQRATMKFPDRLFQRKDLTRMNSKAIFRQTDRQTDRQIR